MQGGLEMNSQGSIQDLENQENQSDESAEAKVRKSQCLANEMEPISKISNANDMESFQRQFSNASDLKSNVDDILKKVDTFIIDEEDVTEALNDIRGGRTSQLSNNDPF